MTNQITDEMIEAAAKMLETLQMQRQYGWTDEQCEIWWNNDPSFTMHKQVWGDFEGTRKERCLWEARIIIEAALNYEV